MAGDDSKTTTKNNQTPANVFANFKNHFSFTIDTVKKNVITLNERWGRKKRTMASVIEIGKFMENIETKANFKEFSEQRIF